MLFGIGEHYLVLFKKTLSGFDLLDPRMVSSREEAPLIY